MPVKMQWSLRSTCLLWYILVPMVGTVLPYYQRENIWQQYRPSSDNLFSLSSGNVWQDQPSWDPPSPFHTGNIWQQEPFSDSSASISSGGAWQQLPPFDSPSPVQPSYRSDLMFPTLFGNGQSKDVTDLEKCFHHIVCTYCKNAVESCNPNMYKPCFSLNFPFSTYSPPGKGRYNPVGRNGFHTSPDTTGADVCTYCETIAASLRLKLTTCDSYCPGSFN